MVDNRYTRYTTGSRRPVGAGTVREPTKSGPHTHNDEGFRMAQRSFLSHGGCPAVSRRRAPADTPAQRTPTALMSILPHGARVYTHRRHGLAVHYRARAWVGAGLADVEQALAVALGRDAADVLERSRWQAGLRLVPGLPGRCPPLLRAGVRGLYSDRHRVLWLRTRSSLAHEVAHYLDQAPQQSLGQDTIPLHSLGERRLWVDAMATTNVVCGRQAMQERMRHAPSAAERATAAQQLPAYDALLAHLLTQSHLVASWEVWARALDQYLATCADRAGWQPRCCRPVAEYATLPEFWSEATLQDLAPQIHAALLARLEARAAAWSHMDEGDTVQEPWPVAA